jgi:hypothetical protein
VSVLLLNGELHRLFIGERLDAMLELPSPDAIEDFPEGLFFASRDEATAIRVDTAVRYTRKDDWRGNRFKEKEVWGAVCEELGADETRADKIFEIVKNQREY